MNALKVKLLKSPKDRSLGLIGKDKPEAIMFYTRFGIHTFGLNFPIDVLILDNGDRVVKIRENLGPNKVFFWPPKYNKVLELPSGFIKNHKIEMESKMKLNLFT